MLPSQTYFRFKSIKDFSIYVEVDIFPGLKAEDSERSRYGTRSRQVQHLFPQGAFLGCSTGGLLHFPDNCPAPAVGIGPQGATLPLRGMPRGGDSGVNGSAHDQKPSRNLDPKVQSFRVLCRVDFLWSNTFVIDHGEIENDAAGDGGGTPRCLTYPACGTTHNQEEAGHFTCPEFKCHCDVFIKISTNTSLFNHIAQTIC